MKLLKRYDDNALIDFANELKSLSRQIGFRVSSRGWSYIMEQKRLINKDEFDKVTKIINTCRKRGFLPIDFVAEESSREFTNVIKPTQTSIYDDLVSWMEGSLNCATHYEMDWWEDEEYYIQMVVEKVDLVTLFLPVCKKYKIPIANSKGWSSMLQRAEYARRFKEAEEDGKKCVLLYCGDHDPDGLRISEFLRKNLRDVSGVVWDDYKDGYDPTDLIIDRFGLNYDFIEENGFTWIDNLITGSGRNLASPNHKNYKMEYVQEYLQEVGERKCEANAIVVFPDIARKLCRRAIEEYLGLGANIRFIKKRNDLKKDFDLWMDESGVREKIDEIIKISEDMD